MCFWLSCWTATNKLSCFQNLKQFELNPFSTNVPFLYPLKISQNLRFSDVFRGYRSETLVEKWVKCFYTSFSAPEARKGHLCSIYVGFFILIYVVFLKETSQEVVNGKKTCHFLLHGLSKDWLIGQPCSLHGSSDNFILSPVFTYHIISKFATHLSLTLLLNQFDKIY